MCWLILGVVPALISISINLGFPVQYKYFALNYWHLVATCSSIVIFHHNLAKSSNKTIAHTWFLSHPSKLGSNLVVTRKGQKLRNFSPIIYVMHYQQLGEWKASFKRSLFYVQKRKVFLRTKEKSERSSSIFHSKILISKQKLS